MATSVADPASAPATEPAAAAAAGPGDGAPAPGVPLAHACANCGAAMDAGQDWCLHCGAGAPASLGSSLAGWRSGATILAATAVLALGAAAAAFAALSKGGHAPRMVTATVAAAPAPAPAPGTGQGGALGTPTTITPAPGASAVKPPRIPLTAITPKAATTTSQPTTATEKTTTTSTATTPASPTGGSSGETQPAALLLDTNAASTYNPYNYSPAAFGDPSLAIDGDDSTGWTAQVDPAVAPKMAEGLVIDLKTGRRLKALALSTSTPGMTIQIYGASGRTLPGSITDPAWVKLSPAIVEHSKHLRLKLKQPKKSFRYVTLWISGAPAASVGTPQAPGRVSVNELELFPAG